jgi:hypothetical protein
MSLTKIVAEVTDAHEQDGVIDRHSAINEAVPRVLADTELTTTCVRAHLSRMIATNAKARTREMAAAEPRQGSIFGLRDVHVVDDGEGKIKHTRALNRVEFAGLISVRQKQVQDDLQYLNRLRDAAAKTTRIWDAHPDWTWGQVEDAYSRHRAAA